MADGSFHTAGGGLEGLGHLRVQYLGDGVDHIHIIDGDDNGFSQILVTFDVGRHTDLMDDAGDQALNAVLVIAVTGIQPLGAAAADLLQPFRQGGHIAGLQHPVPGAQVGCGGGYILRNESGCNQNGRPALHGRNGLQHADAVPLGQHQVQHQHIGLQLQNTANSQLAVIGSAQHTELLALIQGVGQIGAEVFRAVSNKNSCLVFHVIFSCHVNFVRCRGDFGGNDINNVA